MSIISQLILRAKADGGGFDQVKNAISSTANTAKRELSTVSNEFEKTLSGFNRAVLGIRTGILQTAGGFILGSLIQQATSDVINFGKSFISVNSDVQQFKLQFTNLFKAIGLSAEEAGQQTERAFNFAKKVAKETPFDLPDITQAILRLQTFGLSVERFLSRSIDLAAALGKPLEEVTTAFTNLQSRRFGESFEQFARLGIARDLLEGKGLVFDRNGSYQGSVEQAMQAITEIIDERFAGFAESQQGTFKQLRSNLGDIIFQFKEAFGGPIFKGINEDLKDFVGTLDENQPTIEGFGVAFGELFAGARRAASDSFKGIISDLKGGQETTVNDFFEFGVNLFVAFANGILQGGQFVFEAATFVAGGIAKFFESFSPPKFGPLKEIDTWGANLINSYFDGMRNADFGLLSSVLDDIGNIFNSAVGAGLIDTETPEQDFLGLVDTIVNGLDDISAGGDAAHAVFETLAETLGPVAFELEAIVAAGAGIKDLTEDLEAAQQALENMQDENDKILDGLDKVLDDLTEADRKRKELFDIEQDALDEADRAARDSAPSGGGRDSGQDNAIRDQIKALQDSKQAIDDAKDAAIEALEAQRDALLAPLEAALGALDQQVTDASRALEDFNFQSEGIPERFTRQRRRELERILTIKRREQEDAQKAFQEQKKQQDALFKIEKDNIEKNAKAAKKAIDDQIEGLQKQIDSLNDVAAGEDKVAKARKRPKFEPDPRIKEQEDLIKKEKERAKEEEEAARKKIATIQDELKAERARLQELEDKLNARLDLEKLIKAALDEQARILKEQAAAADTKVELLPTKRELDEFGSEFDSVTSKIDEARAKLRELIPQETRDKFKKDIQFFADFFKGLAGIKGPNFDEANKSEGFALGEQFVESVKRIGNAFETEVIPKVKTFGEGLRTAYGFANNLLDAIDKVKNIVASGFKAVGLDGVANAFNTPIRDTGLTLGAYLFALKFIPGGDIIFNFGVKFLSAAVPKLFSFIFGLLGFGGAAGAGGAGAGGAAGAAGTAGAGAGIGAAAVPIAIAIAVILAIGLIFAFATDFKGIRTKTIDFVKKHPEISTILTGFVLPFTIPVTLPIAIVTKFFRSGAAGSIADFVKENIIDPLKNIPDIIGNIGSSIGSGASGLGGFIIAPFKAAADFIKGPFLGAFKDVKSFLGPWGTAVGSVAKVVDAAITLPFKIAEDFLRTLIVPLFTKVLPGAFNIAKNAADKFLSPIFGPILSAGKEVLGFFTEDVIPFFTDTFPSAIGSIVGTVAGVGAQVFNSLFGPILNFGGGVLDAVVGAFSPAVDWIQQNVIPFFSKTLPDAIGNVATTVGKVLSPVAETIKAPFVAGLDFLKDDVVPFFSDTLPNSITGVSKKIEKFLESDKLTHPFSTAKDFITDNVFPFFDEKVPSLFNGFSTKIAPFISNVGENITQPFRKFYDYATGFLGPLLTDKIPGFFTKFKNDSLDALSGFTSNLLKNVGDFTSNIAKIPENIAKPFKGIFETFANFGRNVMSGLISGVNEKVDALVSKFTDVFNKLPAAVKKLFQMTSPSKLFRNIGKDVMKGAEIGFEEGGKSLLNATGDIFSGLGRGLREDINVAVLGTLDTKNIGDLASMRLRGTLAGKVFTEGFRSEIVKSLSANVPGNAFLNVNMNNIQVSVDNKAAIKKITTQSNTQAAKVVSSIITQGGN